MEENPEAVYKTAMDLFLCHFLLTCIWEDARSAARQQCPPTGNVRSSGRNIRLLQPRTEKHSRASSWPSFCFVSKNIYRLSLKRNWDFSHRIESEYRWLLCTNTTKGAFPNSKVHGINIGPIWGRQDPGGPHVGPVNFAIWVDNVMAWKRFPHYWPFVRVIHFSSTSNVELWCFYVVWTSCRRNCWVAGDLRRPGDRLNMKMSSCHYRITIIKIRRSSDRFIFITEISIPAKTVFILRRGPDHVFITEISIPVKTVFILRRGPDHVSPQIAKFMGPIWGPPGSCRPDGPHVGPMNLAIRVMPYLHGLIEPSVAAVHVCPQPV